MIVKYVKERGYNGSGSDPLLTLNKNYIALRTVFRTDGYPTSITVQIDRDGTPGQFDMDCFRIVDARVPLDWNLTTRTVAFCLEPVEFSGDFWDAYHDDDEAAERVFKDTLNKLKIFHSFE